MSFGANRVEAGIISDIAGHTFRTYQQAEAAGGWTALGAGDLFAIEYWELEQAKLSNQERLPCSKERLPS